jgi:hypothetical protein
MQKELYEGTFAMYGGQSDGGAFRAGRMASLQMGRFCLLVSRFQ